MTDYVLVILTESSKLETCLVLALEKYFQNNDIETGNYLKALKYDFWIQINRATLNSKTEIDSLKHSLSNFKTKHLVCIGKFVSDTVLKFELENCIIYPFDKKDNSITLDALTCSVLRGKL